LPTKNRKDRRFVTMEIHSGTGSKLFRKTGVTNSRFLTLVLYEPHRARGSIEPSGLFSAGSGLRHKNHPAAHSEFESLLPAE